MNNLNTGEEIEIQSNWNTKIIPMVVSDHYLRLWPFQKKEDSFLKKRNKKAYSRPFYNTVFLVKNESLKE